MAKQRQDIITYFAFAVLVLVLVIGFVVPQQFAPEFGGGGQTTNLAAVISSGHGLIDFCLDACRPVGLHRHTCTAICSVPQNIVDEINTSFIVGAVVERREQSYNFLYTPVFDPETMESLVNNPYLIFELNTTENSLPATGAATLDFQESATPCADQGGSCVDVVTLTPDPQCPSGNILFTVTECDQFTGLGCCLPEPSPEPSPTASPSPEPEEPEPELVFEAVEVDPVLLWDTLCLTEGGRVETPGTPVGIFALIADMKAQYESQPVRIIRCPAFSITDISTFPEDVSITVWGVAAEVPFPFGR